MAETLFSGLCFSLFINKSSHRPSLQQPCAGRLVLVSAQSSEQEKKTKDASVFSELRVPGRREAAAEGTRA